MTKPRLLYQIARQCYLKKIPVIPTLISKLIRLIFSAEIPAACEIRAGADFAHAALGCCINEKVIIGENTLIMQNVTLGSRGKGGAPTIGKNCFIGVGAVVLGNIHIGDNSKIGANAVVLSDVPPNTTVVGVPAKPIR
jgi:serine O-acetyltransferase